MAKQNATGISVIALDPERLRRDAISINDADRDPDPVPANHEVYIGDKVVTRWLDGDYRVASTGKSLLIPVLNGLAKAGCRRTPMALAECVAKACDRKGYNAATLLVAMKAGMEAPLAKEENESPEGPNVPIGADGAVQTDVETTPPQPASPACESAVTVPARKVRQTEAMVAVPEASSKAAPPAPPPEHHRVSRKVKKVRGTAKLAPVPPDTSEVVGSKAVPALGPDTVPSEPSRKPPSKRGMRPASAADAEEPPPTPRTSRTAQAKDGGAIARGKHKAPNGRRRGSDYSQRPAATAVLFQNNTYFAGVGITTDDVKAAVVVINNQIRRGRREVMLAALEIGKHIVEVLYHGDRKKFGSHSSKKGISLHALVEAGAEMNVQGLWRCATVYLSADRLPAAIRDQLTPTHYVRLLRAPEDKFVNLAEAAVENHWTAQQVAEEVRKLKGKRPASSAVPNLPTAGEEVQSETSDTTTVTTPTTPATPPADSLTDEAREALESVKADGDDPSICRLDKFMGLGYATVHYGFDDDESAAAIAVLSKPSAAKISQYATLTGYRESDIRAAVLLAVTRNNVPVDVWAEFVSTAPSKAA